MPDAVEAFFDVEFEDSFVAAIRKGAKMIKNNLLAVVGRAPRSKSIAAFMKFCFMCSFESIFDQALPSSVAQVRNFEDPSCAVFLGNGNRS
jgi:hypothetical protein